MRLTCSRSGELISESDWSRRWRWDSMELELYPDDASWVLDPVRSLSVSECESFGLLDLVGLLELGSDSIWSMPSWSCTSNPRCWEDFRRSRLRFWSCCCFSSIALASSKSLWSSSHRFSNLPIFSHKLQSNARNVKLDKNGCKIYTIQHSMTWFCASCMFQNQWHT